MVHMHHWTQRLFPNGTYSICATYMYTNIFIAIEEVTETTTSSHDASLPFNITWRPATEQYNPGCDHLVALSDSNNETCLNVDNSCLVDLRILLVGSLSKIFKTLHVAIHTSDRLFRIHGGTCADKWVLMSHVGPKSGITCRPFCDVPTTCNLEGTQYIDSTLITFRFHCFCPEESCSELLLWIWSGPNTVIPSVCEIEASN